MNIFWLALLSRVPTQIVLLYIVKERCLGSPEAETHSKPSSFHVNI